MIQVYMASIKPGFLIMHLMSFSNELFLRSGGALIHEMTQGASAGADSSETLSGGVGLQIPTAASKAAKKGQGREKTET